jgi:hypothetical protein
MPLPCPPRPLPVLASVLAAAGVVLTVASCSHLAPLGPHPTPVAMPPPRHLGSPIILQVMRTHPPTATGRCPAGWAALSLPAGGEPRRAIASSVPVPVGASAPPPPPSSPAPTPCYRPAGTPVTITSAAVSSVFTYRPPPGRATGPDLYGFLVGVPGADIAAVTAVIRQAADTGSAVGITVAGKLWQAPQVFKPFPGQRLQIAFLSRNQALRLYRILVPSG